MIAQRLLAPAVAISLAGCSGDATAPLPDCSGNVEVTVSSGVQPTFSWSPACRLFLLVVEEAPAGGDVWSVMTLGENAIAPPVKYGEVPPGATEFESAAPLISGTTYLVGLVRFIGPDDEDGEVIAAREFNP